MPVSFAFAYARPLHSDIDREGKKSIRFVAMWKLRNSNYASFSELSNTLKNVLS